MTAALGHFQRQPSARRHRAVMAALSRLSLLEHGARWREMTRGETLWLDVLADQLRDIAGQLDAIADDLDDIGPVLRGVLEVEAA